MTAHPSPNSTRRLRRLLRGVGALIILVAVVVGVPLLLTALHMVPRSVPSLHQIKTTLLERDDGQLLAAVLAAAAWVCWALFTASLVPEIAAAARKRPAKPLPGLGAFQRPTGALVTAVAIAFTIAPLVGGLTSTPRAVAARPVAAEASSQQALRHADTPTSPHTDTTRPDTTRRQTPHSSPAPIYQVQRRDTLWRIAERYLGDPLRYDEIARLNPTVVGPDNEITAGAILTMPADATSLPRHDEAAARQQGEAQVSVHPGDTLWSIENRVTGEGSDWPEGWHASEGRPEPGGATFDDPNMIKPGWTLSIPIRAHAAAPPHPDRSTVAGRQRPPGRPTHPGHQTPPRQSTGAARSTESPTSPSTPARSSAPPPTAGHAHDAPTAASTESRRSDAAMSAFVGGGLLLAGVTFTALAGYRRRQFRRRRPGRTLALTPPELIAVERAVLSSGREGVADVTWLDQALRTLVQGTAAVTEARLPDVIAVRMTDDELTLVLANPLTTAPAPWRVDDTGTRWSIQRDDPLGYQPERRGYYFAPFPTLTSVGHTARGECWLLDLERIGSLCLAGDAERCLDLARFLAAELAHNTWSEMLHVTLVGFGDELVGVNPDRLSYTDDLVRAIHTASHDLSAAQETMRAAEVDVLAGRLHDVAGDAWAPRVVLIAAHLAGDTAGLDTLLAALKRQPGRAPLAVVLAGDTDRADSTGWNLRIGHDGMMSIPALGIELIAHQIPAEEAAQLAQLLTFAAVSEDRAIPAALGERPWDEFADACGGLTVRTPATASSEAGTLPALHLGDVRTCPPHSVLSLAPQAYLERAATTEEALRALAPVVDDDTRTAVEHADPHLDRDLSSWYDPACVRPRLTLLGEVSVRAQGELPRASPQRSFHTEVVAYLATRSNGALSNVYAETMWPNDPDVVGKTKVRQSINTVRTWLGRDPDTGEEYLPSALHEAGRARYRIVGALVDAELFRRLRVRGLSRGAEGIDDLWRALELVQGQPFAELPEPRRGAPGGYGWVSDANSRLDAEYSTMIVDTAHTVAIHHFGARKPELAAKAAQVSLKGGTYEDTPLLDLVRACLAQDKEAEAEAYVRQILSNHDAEVEEDLPPRTAEVLFRLHRQRV